MAKPNLIAAVDQALAALKAARKAFVASTRQNASTKSTTNSTEGKQVPAKKGMSAEGRLRIAEAQRKRWAASKRAAKKAARLAGK